jgi:VWFA-related protein
MKRPASIALVLALLGAFVHGQEPEPQKPPVFRAQVDLVEVKAFVTDRDGRPVTDLTADDFEVLEDGVRQTIGSVGVVNIPVDADEGNLPAFREAEVEPDVRTNEMREGRLYVIAVDQVTPINAMRSRMFLRTFVDRYVGAADQVAVVHLGQADRSDAQEFTSDRALVLRAIERISGWDIPGSIARNRMMALRDLMEFLGRIRGRHKAVLMLTEDVSVDMFNAVDTPLSAATESAATDVAREAMRAALRGNVSIYPIDPRGLSLADVVDGSSESGATIEVDQARRAASLARQMNLRSFGYVTGGFAHVASNNFEGTFARIVLENSAYYVIGYYPGNERHDGRFRQLQVRVRRAGLQVRTINGYLAPAGTTPVRTASSPVADVISGPLAQPRLPLRVFAAPYRTTGEDAAVVIAVEIDGRSLELPRNGDLYTGRLEVGYFSTHARGRTPGQRYTVDLQLRPESYEQLRRTGLRVLLEPRLRPGQHQLRIGVAHLGALSGSVIYDINVPDFTGTPLAMGGVALISAAGAGVRTTGDHPTVGARLPAPITATREFAIGDRLTVFTEVYDNTRASNAQIVRLRVEVQSPAGEVLRTATGEQRASAQDARRAHAFQVPVPLDNLPAGR